MEARTITVPCAHCGADLVTPIKDGDVYIIKSCSVCREFMTVEAPDGMLLPEAAERNLVEFYRYSFDGLDKERMTRRAEIAGRQFAEVGT